MAENWVEAIYSWPTYMVHVGEGYVLCPDCAQEDSKVELCPCSEVESPDVCDNCGRTILGPTIIYASGCSYLTALEGLQALGDASELDPKALDLEEIRKNYRIDPLAGAYGLLTDWPNGLPVRAWEVYGHHYLVLEFENGTFLPLEEVR